MKIDLIGFKNDGINIGIVSNNSLCRGLKYGVCVSFCVKMFENCNWFLKFRV